MRNVWRIFRDDMRALRGSIISVLVTLALCLAPAVFAWAAIAGSWDPYGNSGSLKIAVSNSDDGYESSLMPMRLNVGDRVVSTLRNNDEYDWVFVSEREAVDGVRSGDYYAAITIPREFSSTIMSAFSSEAEQVSVGFYLNSKENPSVQASIGAGGSELEEDVRAKFTEAVGEMSLGLASDLVSFAGGDNAREFGARLVAHLDTAAEDLDSAADQIRSFANVMGATASMASAASGAMVDAQKVTDDSGETVDKASELLNAALERAQSAAADIEGQVKSAKSSGGLGGVGTETAAKLASDLTTLASNVGAVARESDAVASSLDEVAKSLSDSTKSVAGSLESIRDQLNVSANKLNASSAKIRKFQDDVATAIARGNLNDVATIVSGAKTSLAQWLANPVKVDQRVMYPAKDYASSVAPFYTVLSLWLGALLMVFVMSAGVPGDRLRRYEEEGGKPVKGYAQYLGRYLVFAVVALLQATIVGVGNLFFLRIGCAQPFLFLAACWACAIVFSCIAYTLVASFGGVGTALCVVLLALQVVGMGLEYPVQAAGDVFQAVSPFLPFTHATHALQGAISGIYGNEYAFDLLRVAAFLVSMLLLGLALRRPLSRVAERLAAFL